MDQELHPLSNQTHSTSQSQSQSQSQSHPQFFNFKPQLRSDSQLDLHPKPIKSYHPDDHQKTPTQFPSYSSILDIRMPTTLDRPASLTHHQQDQPRKRDPNHPFQKLTHQPTPSEDHPPNKPALQHPSPKHPTQPNLLLCCTLNPSTAKPHLSIPLTRRASHDARTLAPAQSDLDGGAAPRQRTSYLPLQTVISAGLLVGIPTLFIYSTASDLIRHHRTVGTIILAVFSYIWAISLSSMVKTVVSDPGILPRALDPSPEMKWAPASSEEAAAGQPAPPSEEKPPGLEVGQWLLLPRWIKLESASPHSHPHLNADKLFELGLNPDHHVGWIQSKWCSTCQTYRPPRSSHCRICDCCIEGIDHHCSYLNNCIGSRNYRSFFVFLLTSSIDLMIMIGCSVWKIFGLRWSSANPQNNPSNPSQSVSDSLKAHPIDIVIISLSVLIFIPIIALTGYHIYLTFKGLTTIEYIKSQTTKKVIKENAKLVDQFYPAKPANPDGGGAANPKWGARVWGAMGCRGATGGPLPQYNSFVIGRLCRPDTESFIDWDALV